MVMEFPYGHGVQRLTLDEREVQGILRPSFPQDGKARDARAIVEAALDAPIGSKKLEELAQGKRKIVLIASDHTRPVPNKVLLPAMLRRIRLGNPDAEITILVATGCHRATSRAELEAMFGKEICETEKIVVHDCDDEENLITLGTLPSGGVCRINRLAAEADLLVSSGFIEPHFFAGFSGGRKSILPGIAARETVVYNHNAAFIDSPYAKTGNLADNPIHADMCWAAEKARLAFILNVVIDPKHAVLAAFAGDREKAHAAGCALSRALCAAQAVAAEIAVVSNGGYPLDQNIYQAVKGMSAAEAAVKEGGVIVMLAESSDGVGGEYFFRQSAQDGDYPQALQKYLARVREKTEPDQWQTQIFLRVRHKAKIIYVSSVPDETVRALGMIPASSVQEAYATAREIAGENAKVNLIPDGVNVIIEEKKEP
ncbi:MAG: nickel-dependent lactate racemase [Oscillospiraceae bacterium]|nr:nickel-dependent lactate racemase [Oscillospiraceae bacterium]